MRFSALLVVLFASIGLIGCGAKAKLETVRVKGKLLVDGKPYGSCLINFASNAKTEDAKEAEAKKSALGKVNADGTFELTTYSKGDGAVPGSYTVTLLPDMEDMKSVGQPTVVIKPLTVEVAKSADGKPVELEVKAESTGETAFGGGAGHMRGMSGGSK